MNFFKIIISSLRSFGLLVLLVLSVSACVKPSARGTDPNADFSDPAKTDAAQSNATFVAKEVTGSAVVSKSADGFSIAVEKIFRFQTCLIDKRTQETVKGHKFQIKGAGGIVSSGVNDNGRSDESGCFPWSEKIVFNEIADAKFLLLKRTIVAEGMHTGARELTICINPWEKSDEVQDCGRKAVPEDQLVRAGDVTNQLNNTNKDGQQFDRYLWIDDLRITAAHDPGGSDGAAFDFSASMAPKVLRKDVRGNTSPLVLADGVFSFQFWIIAKRGSGGTNGNVSFADRCYVLAKSDPSKDFAMVGGRMREEMKMKIRYMSTYGQIELAGRVTPKSNSVNLGPYNGLWLLGDHAGLFGMKFGFERKEAYKEGPGVFDAKAYADSCIDVSDGKLLEGPHSLATKPGAKISQFEFRGAEIYPSGHPNAGEVKTPARDLELREKLTLANFGKPVLAALGRHGMEGKVEIPADLDSADCVEVKDIPRLFHKDPVAKNFRGGNDFLSCVNKNLPSGIIRVEQFEFANVIVKPEPVREPLLSETTTERSVRYSVTTVVTNPLAQNARMSNIEFEIETEGGGTPAKARTNHEGILIFSDDVKHSYFEPERYILKVVTIRNQSGFSKRLAVVMNPWDNNGFTFGRDLRAITKQTVAQVNLVNRPPSELLLTQFQWGTQGFRYEVDKLLDLTVYKQFNLTISPRVLRYSSLTDGRMKNEPLRDGVYIMKVAIQKDYEPLNQKPLQYVTALKKLVRVASGIINTPVEMKFKDFRVLKIRSNIMIEIATIDERKLTLDQRKNLSFDGPIDSLIEAHSGLVPRTFIGPVVAYSNGFSASMRPTDDLSESVCETIDCDEIKKNELIAIQAKLDSDAKEVNERLQKAATETERKELVSKLNLLISEGATFKTFRTEAMEKLAKKQARDLVTLRNLNEESEKFVGSVKHLAGWSVGKAIQVREHLDALAASKANEFAQLKHLLDAGNFEFASFYNEELIAKRENGVANNNFVLQNGHGFEDLVRRMSKRVSDTKFVSPRFIKIYREMAPKDSLDLEVFRRSLFENQDLTYDQAARFCLVFVEGMNLGRDAKADVGYSADPPYIQRLLNEACVHSLYSSTMPGRSTADVFSFEHFLRVSKVYTKKNDPTRQTGPSFGNLLSLKVDAGASSDRGKSKSFSWSWNPLAMAKDLAGLAGAGGKIVQTFMDASGLSIGWSGSESDSVSEGTSMGAGTSLAVELRVMRITIAEHERCAAIRFNQNFVAKFAGHFQLANKAISPAERALRANRGILICEGTSRREPLTVDERYYQFSQALGEEAMNDPSHILNHPYLMSIRGRSDYVRFVSLIKRDHEAVGTLAHHLSIGEAPMDRLMSLFGTPTPTFPGILRLDPLLLKQIEPMKPNQSSSTGTQKSRLSTF